MKKRGLLISTCVAVVLLLCMLCTVLSYADTDVTDADTTTGDVTTAAPGGEQTPESEYYVTLYDTNTKYYMEKESNSYKCTVSLDGGALYRFGISDADGEFETYLLYKSKKGDVNFTWTKSGGVSLTGASDDISQKGFDLSSKQYLVTVDGGYITELEGSFAGKRVESFYFAAGDSVSIEAEVDEEAGATFLSWSCETKGVNLPATEKATFTLPNSSKNVLIKAQFEYQELSLDKLLKPGEEITLERDYELDEPITLTAGDYVIDLDGHKISCASTVFILNSGATLTVKGEGEIKQTTSASGYGILVNKGATLNIDGGEISGQVAGIEAKGGTLIISDGDISGAVSAAIRMYDDCEVFITGGSFISTGITKTAISVSGGSLEIEGGTFYGKNSIVTYGNTADIKIAAGVFESDITKYLADGSSAVKGADGKYTVTVDIVKYTVTVFGGKGGGSYAPGESVTVVANNDDDVSEFIDWSVLSGELEIEDNTLRTVTFTMPECDLALKANFKIESIDTGVIDSDTLPPVSDTETGDDTAVIIGGEVTTDPSDTQDKTDVTTTEPSGDGGAFAIIILIIILIALLVAAIIVAIILIVRRYNIEKAATARAELGESLVNDLADQLSDLDFGDDFITGEGAGGSAVAGAANDVTQNVKLREVKKAKKPTQRIEANDSTREVKIDQTNGENK